MTSISVSSRVVVIHGFVRVPGAHDREFATRGSRGPTHLPPLAQPEQDRCSFAVGSLVSNAASARQHPNTHNPFTVDDYTIPHPPLSRHAIFSRRGI